MLRMQAGLSGPGPGPGPSEAFRPQEQAQLMAALSNTPSVFSFLCKLSFSLPKEKKKVMLKL